MILAAVVVTLLLVVELEFFVILCSVDNAVVSDKRIIVIQARIKDVSVDVHKYDAGVIFFDH